MEKGYLEKFNGDENIFYCLRQYPKQKTAVRAHYHGDIEFLYGIGCDMTVWIDGETWNMQDGDFIIIRPFETHSVVSECRRSDHLVIRFSPEILKYKGQQPQHRLYAMPLADSMTKCRRLIKKEEAQRLGIDKEFKAAVDEYYSREFGYEVAVHQGILKIALQLIRYWQKIDKIALLSNSDSSITRIRKAAAAASEDVLSANEREAAKSCFMSYSYFSRTFKKIIGMSYSDYVMAVKLRNAQRILMTTEKSISDIADEMGFATSSHFIEHFKKYFGKPPYAYKKEFKEKFE